MLMLRAQTILNPELFLEVTMKSKLKIGLVILAALVFSASFGYIVRQIMKGHEAESAFQSLSEQFFETESETAPDETEKPKPLMPKPLILEESTESLSGDTEDPIPLPVIKKPFRERPEPAEESTSAVVTEETPADPPSVEVTESKWAAPVPTIEVAQPYVTSANGHHGCVGWIRIDGTAINYPVMQSKEDPEFYLHHAVSGEYSYPGVPFLDARCEVGVSNHLVIYGHNMKNGTMFHNLRNYSSYSWWQSHRKICLNTVDGAAIYEVMAVIRYDSDHDPFRFNAFTKMDADTFTWFVAQVKARQIYETGVTASFGDDLLTLSTCDWTFNNGRLLVVAKRAGN